MTDDAEPAPAVPQPQDEATANSSTMEPPTVPKTNNNENPETVKKPRKKVNKKPRPSNDEAKPKRRKKKPENANNDGHIGGNSEEVAARPKRRSKPISDPEKARKNADGGDDNVTKETNAKKPPKRRKPKQVVDGEPPTSPADDGNATAEATATDQLVATKMKRSKRKLKTKEPSAKRNTADTDKAAIKEDDDQTIKAGTHAKKSDSQKNLSVESKTDATKKIKKKKKRKHKSEINPPTLSLDATNFTSQSPQTTTEKSEAAQSLTEETQQEPGNASISSGVTPHDESTNEATFTSATNQTDPISTEFSNTSMNDSSSVVIAGFIEPNEQASKLESIPTSIPPKPCLETEREYQNLTLLNNYDENNNATGKAITFEEAKKKHGHLKSARKRPPPLEAPADLLSVPNGGPETDALLMPEECPIEDPMERHKDLQQRNFRRKKILIIGSAFVLAVVAAALIFTFVIGWSDDDDDDGNTQAALSNTASPTPAPLPPVTPAPTARPLDESEEGWGFLPAGVYNETIQALENDSSSPQSRAYQWLSEDPQLETYPDWRLLQRFAVATMVFSLRLETGESAISNLFSDNDPWLDSETSECDWGKARNPPACNDQGRMQHLELTSVSGVNNDLKAFIPVELTLLSNLQRLTLAANGIATTWTEFVPNNMHQLEAAFEQLDVSKNKIGGSLESTSPVFQLSNLKSFDASQNRLTGRIPRELSLLSDLELLNLESNQLSGSIPVELGDLSSLKRLQLGKTSITGTIPTQLALLESTLIAVSLHHTLLFGRVPSEIGLLSELRTLDLSVTAISGLLPTEIGAMTSCRNLSLSGTALSGVIPSQVGQMQSLEDMLVSKTLLGGNLPSEIGLLKSLQRLELAGNSHSEAIPSELSGLQALTYLDISSNSLTGPLPKNLDKMTALQHLDLSKNFMSGKFQLNNSKKLSNLRVFRIGGNYISGTIPSNLGSLKSLVELDLSESALSSTVPSHLGLLTNLRTLKLSSNFLTGELPVELCELSSLRKLVVDCDKIECGECDCECE